MPIKSSHSLLAEDTALIRANPGFGDLPALVLQEIAQQLDIPDLKCLHQACQAARSAARSACKVLPLCRHPSVPWEWQVLPPAVVDILGAFPNVKELQLPGGWGPPQLCSMLTVVPRPWGTRIATLEIHLAALSPDSATAMCSALPQLHCLRLYLHIPQQSVGRRAWRMSALSQLPSLTSLTCESPLGADALDALSSCPHLQHLDLSPAVTTHEPGSSLLALARLTGLTSLRFCWAAGRTMPSAAPLGQLTGLRSLHVFLGAGDAFPPCSGRPLADLLQTVGTLQQLEELQLLQGLRMSQDCQGFRHLQALNNLKALGLHDTLLREPELQLLSAIPELRHLQVDAIQLLGPTAHDATNLSLPTLQVLSVNVLSLAGHSLRQLCPVLQQLGPMHRTMNFMGYGASLDLTAVAAHSALNHLGLCYRPGTPSSQQQRQRQQGPEQQPTCGAMGSARSGMWCVTAESPCTWLKWLLNWAAAVVSGSHKTTQAGVGLKQLVQLLHQMPHLQALDVWLPVGTDLPAEPPGVDVAASSCSQATRSSCSSNCGAPPGSCCCGSGSNSSVAGSHSSTLSSSNSSSGSQSSRWSWSWLAPTMNSSSTATPHNAESPVHTAAAAAAAAAEGASVSCGCSCTAGELRRHSIRRHNGVIINKPHLLLPEHLRSLYPYSWAAGHAQQLAQALAGMGTGGSDEQGTASSSSSGKGSDCGPTTTSRTPTSGSSCCGTPADPSCPSCSQPRAAKDSSSKCASSSSSSSSGHSSPCQARCEPPQPTSSSYADTAAVDSAASTAVTGSCCPGQVQDGPPAAGAMLGQHIWQLLDLLLTRLAWPQQARWLWQQWQQQIRSLQQHQGPCEELQWVHQQLQLGMPGVQINLRVLGPQRP